MKLLLLISISILIFYLLRPSVEHFEISPNNSIIIPYDEEKNNKMKLKLSQIPTYNFNKSGYILDTINLKWWKVPPKRELTPEIIKNASEFVYNKIKSYIQWCKPDQGKLIKYNFVKGIGIFNTKQHKYTIDLEIKDKDYNWIIRSIVLKDNGFKLIGISLIGTKPEQENDLHYQSPQNVEIESRRYMYPYNVKDGYLYRDNEKILKK